MVKLDNWQTKAEKAADRRLVTKQRKQQRDRTRSNKALAQNLFSFLDQHNGRLISLASESSTAASASSKSARLEVHFWTDSTLLHPSSEIVGDHEDRVSPGKKKGRPRSNSEAAQTVASTPQSAGSGGKKGRNRSNSDANSGPKKGRPRSSSNASEQQQQQQQESESGIRKLCCNHFFGQCSSLKQSRRKGSNKVESSAGCNVGIHLSNQNPTLCEVLGGRSGSQEKDRIVAAREAMVKSQQAALSAFGHDESPGNVPIDMLYHAPVIIQETNSTAYENFTTPKISDMITNELSAKSCSAGSIVYLAMNGILVFDRYREGLVLSDRDETMLLYGGAGSKRRAISIGEDAQRNDHVLDDLDVHIREHHQRLVMYLPGQVLEYILTFLEDNGVAILPLVCKSWSNEIGKSSPDLWRFLLDRRGWPDADTGPTNARDASRNYFVSQYTAVRDLNAILDGLSILQNAGQSSPVPPRPNRDVAALHYADVGKTFSKIWSPTRALIGNRRDCTLSLCDVLETNGGTGKRCKQSLRVSVAPFPSSKKRECKLEAVDLDDRFVGCLFQAGSLRDPETLLGLVGRDDLVCAGDAGSGVSYLEEGALRTYNLHAKFRDFLPSSGDVEVLSWIDNLTSTRDAVGFQSIHIDIQKNIVACGSGCFMFEAVVFFSASSDDDSLATEDMEDARVVRAFVFSVDFGEITWMGPREIAPVPISNSLFHELKTSLAGTTGGSGLETEGDDCRNVAAFWSSVAGNVVRMEVHGPGRIACSTISSSDRSSGEILRDMEMLHPRRGSTRVVQVSESEIVLAVTCDQIDDDAGRCKTAFLFYRTNGDGGVGENSKSNNNNNNNMDYVILSGKRLSFPVVSLRDKHLITFCLGRGVLLMAAIIHVPSRRVIHQQYIRVMRSSVLRPDAFSIAAFGDSIAVSVDELGMFLAGRGVASVGLDAWKTKGREEGLRPEKEKKKKKAPHKRREKKDIFARGMRQSSG